MSLCFAVLLAFLYMCLCLLLYKHVPVCTSVYFTSRSGTEEDYTALHQLLEDITAYMKDFVAAKDVKNGLSKKKDVENKKKGEEMRKAAMENLASTYIYHL